MWTLVVGRPWPPAARVKLNTCTSLPDKAKVKDEKNIQAHGGTDMYY